MYTWFHQELQFALSQRVVHEEHFSQVFLNYLNLRLKEKMKVSFGEWSSIHACFLLHALASCS